MIDKAPERRVTELDGSTKPDGTREYIVEELLAECRGFAPIEANDRLIETILSWTGTVSISQMLADCEDVLDKYGVERPITDQPEPTPSILLVMRCLRDFGTFSPPWYAARCLLFKQLANDDDLLEVACVNFGSTWQQMVQKSKYEPYARAGFTAKENRAKGRAIGSEQLRRDGHTRRRAIADAAKKLLSKEPELDGNRTELARRIATLGLPELEKSNGGQIGVDAIRKNLKRIFESALL